VSSKAQRLYLVIREVRACFHALKSVADEALADLDVNAATRAVLETTAEGPPRTVPQIARMKRVSRQHIQMNVDALLERGLVAMQDNPAHKRSPFVVLTARGRQIFSRSAAVSSLLETFAVRFSAGALDGTAKTLRTLRTLCESTLKKGDTDD
jgi:DNA-binding MarR family transcriptional regulator